MHGEFELKVDKNIITQVLPAASLSPHPPPDTVLMVNLPTILNKVSTNFFFIFGVYSGMY